jgi:hypothetical protein
LNMKLKDELVKNLTLFKPKDGLRN